MSLQPTTLQIPEDVVKTILDHLHHRPSLSAVSLHNAVCTTQSTFLPALQITNPCCFYLSSFSTLLRTFAVSSTLFTSPHFGTISTRSLFELHAILRKLSALKTLTLSHVGFWTLGYVQVEKLHTSPAAIEIMDVFSNRNRVAALLRPLSTPYTLNICRLAFHGIGMDPLATDTYKLTHAPRSLKIRSSSGFDFLEDVGHLFLDISHLNVSFVADQFPVLATVCPTLTSIGLVFVTSVHTADSDAPITNVQGVTAAHLDLVLKLLSSANMASLFHIMFWVWVYLAGAKEVRYLESVLPHPKLRFGGNWHGLAHTLDRFPNLASVKVLQTTSANMGLMTDSDFSTPLEGVYQTELQNIFPLLRERELLHLI
ncbi:hypothetical protein EUX98_g3105 [Antrodiella citrinella]|uniref:Uncharacterized protein n=1 Tax=Antrodiella citrinella TaxID=2447956 RepID=A0A4S4N5M4_9APHY|nr:hypothetical protein EUX98_g3105 [Antrodiella citrinella]